MENDNESNSSSRQGNLGLRWTIGRKLRTHTWSEAGGSGWSEWFSDLGGGSGWGEWWIPVYVRGLFSVGCIASGVVLFVLRGLKMALIASGLLLCGVSFGMLCICSYLYQIEDEGGGSFGVLPGISLMTHSFAICFVSCMLPALTVLGFENDRLYLLVFVPISGYMIDTLILKAHIRMRYIYAVPPWLLHTCLCMMGKTDFKVLRNVNSSAGAAVLTNIGHDLILLIVTGLMCSVVIGLSRVNFITHHRPLTRDTNTSEP